MAKKPKRNLLLTTFFLVTLLTFTTYTTLIPSVSALQPTNPQQKGIAILSDVVGLDLTKYSITTKTSQQNTSAPNPIVLSQEDVSYELVSSENKLKLLCTFANGNLRIMHVLENVGSPSLVKPSTSILEMAKDFLENYQTYTNNPLYGELKLTLDSVETNTKNITKTFDNKVLEVTTTTAPNYSTLRWYYAANGAIAPYSKCVVLTLKDGFLKSFVDNWYLYTIGSTTVNLSKNQAVNIGLDAAKSYNWSLKLEDEALDVKNFNESNVCWTSLLFDDSLNADAARNKDPLMLYPVWRVGLALNKWYGQMYGVEVDVWADTGIVRSVQQAYSTLPPPEGAPNAEMNKTQESTNQVSNLTGTNSSKSQMSAVFDENLGIFAWILIPAIDSATIVATLVLVKKKNFKLNLVKRHYSRKAVILLCGLTSSIILFAPLTVVGATTRAGAVWGSESTGQYDYYTRKSYTEIMLQRPLSYFIAEYFGDNGYDGYNNQGSEGTTSVASEILDALVDLQDDHDYVAVVDFDHGVGRPDYRDLNEWHYMFEDNIGTYHNGNKNNAVYDLDIGENVDPNKIIFAFINTCMSANNSDTQSGYDATWGMTANGVRGMPYAWTGCLLEHSSTPGSGYMSDDGYLLPDTHHFCYIGFPWGSASLEQKIPYDYGDHIYGDWVQEFFYYALYWDMSINEALDEASLYTWEVPFGDANCPLRNGFYARWYPSPVFETAGKMAVFGNGNIHLKQYEPDYVTTPAVNGPTAGDISETRWFSACSLDPSGHNIRYTFDWGDETSTVTSYSSSATTVYESHSWSSGAIYDVQVRAECSNGEYSSWSSVHRINIGNQPEYYWLSVRAYEGYYDEIEVEVGVDVDYESVGTTPVSVYKLEGGYYVGVPDYFWDSWLECYVYFQYFSGDFGVCYDNPLYIEVGSETLVKATYAT